MDEENSEDDETKPEGIAKGKDEYNCFLQGDELER